MRGMPAITGKIQTQTGVQPRSLKWEKFTNLGPLKIGWAGKGGGKIQVGSWKALLQQLQASKNRDSTQKSENLIR